MAQYTPEQYGDLLERFVKGLPEVYKRASLLAAKDLEGEIKQRVFNTGGTKDIEGNKRKYRSKPYVKKRSKAGLTQLTNVDHSFTGDLQRSIKIRELKKSVAVKIIGNKEVIKARSNEDYFTDEGKAKVFEASKAEEKRAIEIIDEEINKYINKFFD